MYVAGKLPISPRISERVASLLEPAAFAQLKDTLYGQNWVVFTKAPLKKPDALLRYPGLYTHRVAISNHRILHVDDNHVVFRTRDKKVCQLTPLEFMRRFLLHVLPSGFVKIRHFGLNAAGNVNSKLAVARAALELQREDESDTSVLATNSTRPTPVSDLGVGTFSTDSSPPSCRRLAQHLVHDLGARQIRLLFVHVRMAGIPSRTRGFVQHVV
jgi:hypothetical protein